MKNFKFNWRQIELIQDCVAIVTGNRRLYGYDIRELLELMDSIEKQIITKNDGSK